MDDREPLVSPGLTPPGYFLSPYGLEAKMCIRGARGRPEDKREPRSRRIGPLLRQAASKLTARWPQG